MRDICDIDRAEAPGWLSPMKAQIEKSTLWPWSWLIVERPDLALGTSMEHQQCPHLVQSRSDVVMQVRMTSAEIRCIAIADAPPVLTRLICRVSVSLLVRR